MPDLRILSTADLHLGRSSACLGETGGVDTSAAGAWLRIARRAVEESAHAVVVAGDVFDGLGTYYESRKAFLAGLEILDREGIPVIAVAGNHDFEALPRFARQCPLPTFHVLGLGGQWESKEVETKGGRINFVGWSFPEERVSHGQMGALEPGGSRYPTIGVVHGDTAPRSQYHPITASDFERGADAWVVGHIHAPGAIAPNVHYPGSPQALDFGPGERGAHGFKWLTRTGKRWSFSEVEPVSTVRFEEMELAVGPAEGEDPWSAAMRAAEDRARDLREGQPHLLSVQLRVRAVFSGLEQLPNLAEGYDHLTTGAGAVSITEARLKPGSDRWKLVEGPTVIGEVARLLLGLDALTGPEPDERVEAAWVQNAGMLVEQGMDAVRDQFRRTVRRVSDEGDGARSEPDDDEARALACSALRAQLENMLAELEGVA